jgi:hypothetical protein
MRCTPRNQLVLSSQHGSLAIRASFAGEREAGLPLTICAQAHERLPARRPGSARPPPPGMGMGPPVPGMMPPGRGVLMRPTLPGMPPRMPGMQPPGRGAMPGLGMPTPRGVPAQPGPVRGAAMPAGVLPRPLPGGAPPMGAAAPGAAFPPMPGQARPLQFPGGARGMPMPGAPMPLAQHVPGRGVLPIPAGGMRGFPMMMGPNQVLFLPAPRVRRSPLCRSLRPAGE